MQSQIAQNLSCTFYFSLFSKRRRWQTEVLTMQIHIRMNFIAAEATGASQLVTKTPAGPLQTHTTAQSQGLYKFISAVIESTEEMGKCLEYKSPFREGYIRVKRKQPGVWSLFLRPMNVKNRKSWDVFFPCKGHRTAHNMLNIRCSLAFNIQTQK